MALRLSPALAVVGLLLGAAVRADAEPAPRLVVFKGERRLEVRQDNRVVKSYRIGLGANPIGTKLRQGDGRTPEGTFYVCVKNPKSKFHLSLGLSYPTPADAARGLEEKLISRAQHDAILAAHQRRATPPWNTMLGGEIFIHGNGAGSDWTLGCIALDDADMTELFAKIPVGTPVEVRP